MCVGERCDSLDAVDRTVLGEVVRTSMPSYRLSWWSNSEAMVWAVLDQSDPTPRSPRFTICRIDHCLVLMIEAGSAARQFCSAATPGDVIAVASAIAREMMQPCDDPGAATCAAPLILQ